jgi:hypothetical protein
VARRGATAVLLAVVLTAGCGGSGVEVGDVRLAEMDSYGCGYGFWLGTPDQDVAVVLAAADGEAVAREDVPRAVTLPDPAWDGTVRVGRDLFANWCDDVLEPGEPESVVREEWPITGGRIVLHGAPSAECPTEATATLEGLEATRPDGSTVELGGREVTNTSWGCFAG